jgi:glycosyltransferase involved in cell wall biosynthesis
VATSSLGVQVSVRAAGLTSFFRKKYIHVMSSLLIFEPHWVGHNMRYVLWIAKEAVSQGYTVRLATSAGFLEHPFYFTLQRECKDSIRLVVLPGNNESRPAERLTGYTFHYYKMFAECYGQLPQHERPDYVLIPYLDYCAHAVGLLGSPFGDAPWGGIIIDPIFHLNEMGIRVPWSLPQWIKKKLFFRLLRDKALRRVFTLDRLLVRYVSETKPDLAKSVCFIPEPAEVRVRGSQSRVSARRALGIPGDATVVLVYGVLDDSKGLDILLRSMQSDGFTEEVSVLAAGPQAPKIRALLASSQAKALRDAGRIHERNDFLYGEGEQEVFSASDIVWVGYRRQYISSGVLIQAAMAGLPIVACEEGLIGWLTRNHGLGLTVDIGDERAVVMAISELARNKELFRKFTENGRRFSLQHTVDRFSQAIGRELLLSFPAHA